jgi:hypothetical protein
MRRFACFAVIMLVTLVPASASALTVRDVIELTRAGLGDEILLALIDVDPSVFPIDTATLKRLKEAGVSERVILAMVRSARTPAPQPTVDVPIAEAPPAPQPQVVVIEHHDEPQVREVPVAVPVYIPVPTRSVHRGSDYQRPVSQSSSGTDRRSGETDNARDKESHKRAEPVYWGFGGTLRPDAWQPAPEGRKRR